MTTKIKNKVERAALTDLSAWFNIRHKRSWLLLALLFYSVLGFFVVSAVIKTKLVDIIEEDLGRSAHVQSVFFNPYALSLRIRQFEMRDTDQTRLAAFDDFYINFQLSSLFRWALTFDEIRLDNSYVFYERFGAADSRLSRILAEVASHKAPQNEAAEEEKAGGLPRLLIHELALNGGAVKIQDNVPVTPVEMSLGPIDINIKKLNTLPDQYGKQVVAIDLPDNARLKWVGKLSLTPLDSKGKVTLSNANLDVATAYLQSVMPLESLQARLSSQFDYQVRLNEAGQIDVDIDNIGVELNNVAVTGLTPSTEFFTLQQLALQGGKLRYPEQEVEFSRLSITEPKIMVWRKEDGALSVNELVPAPDDSAPAQSEMAATSEESAAGVALDNSQDSLPGKPWHIVLDTLALSEGRFDFSDDSIKPAAQIGIRNLAISAENISNQPGVKMPLKVAAKLSRGGDLALDGNVKVLPDFSLSLHSKTHDIPLAIAQPYVQQYSRIKLDQGVLNSDLMVNLAADKPLSIAGALQVPGLEIKDSIESKRLLAWENLNIEQLSLDLGANKLALSPLQFEQLFARIIIYKDKTTNLSGLVIEQAPKSTTQEKPGAGDKFDVVIGGVSIKQSGMDFSDLSLPLPFATRIKDLNGSISTIAMNSSQPANIKLEGQVDDYGLARINGAINLLDPLHRTAIGVQFRNLLMSNLSPYTVDFAGREIAEGKLNLGLNYEITKSQLLASNQVVISDLELGAKIDHPDAVDLPLGLAVALLKDASGKIDINLPIEGNIDDPQFRIGGIIFKAFADLIVKAVTSPFRLLGGLIGVESDELGKFQFLAGRTDLTPPELEKVAHIKKALAQRPNLNVEIIGATAYELDRPALQYSALRKSLIAGLSESAAAELSDVDILDQRLFKPLTALFRERFPETSLKTVREQHKKPPADNPEGKLELDQLSYAADLRDRLLATVEISEKDLIALAQARGQSLRDAFLADGFDASRVVMGEPKTVDAEDDQWVKFELGVVANSK